MATGRLLPGYGLVVETKASGALLPGFALLVETEAAAPGGGTILPMMIQQGLYTGYGNAV